MQSVRGKYTLYCGPMYKKYKDKQLLVGWYYGDNKVCYLDYVIELVKKVASKSGIGNSNIIFYGSLTGGNVSIYCAHKLEGSAAIAWNSQFRISDFHYCKTFEKITGLDVVNDTLNRNDISEMVLNNKKSRFILLENRQSEIDVQQIEKLLGED